MLVGGAGALPDNGRLVLSFLPAAAWCTQHMASGLGISTQNGQLYCKSMSGCGWAGKCGDLQRQTPACPFSALLPAGQEVPGDASTAFNAVFAGGACPAGFTAPCPTSDEYWKAVNHMEKAYIHEGEEDWIKADSVLFNAFIFLQLFNEVGRWAAHRRRPTMSCLGGLQAVAAGATACVRRRRRHTPLRSLCMHLCVLARSRLRAHLCLGLHVSEPAVPQA